MSNIVIFQGGKKVEPVKDDLAPQEDRDIIAAMLQGWLEANNEGRVHGIGIIGDLDHHNIRHYYAASENLCVAADKLHVDIRQDLLDDDIEAGTPLDG